MLIMKTYILNPLLSPRLNPLVGGRGGECPPYDGLYGEALPEKGTVFRLQVDMKG